MIHPLRHAPTIQNLSDALPTLPSSSSTRSLEVTAYELRARSPLPTIDCSKAIKHILLNREQLRRFDAFKESNKWLMNVAFALGLVLACIGPVVGRNVGEGAAVVSTALLLAPLAVSTMELHVDMLALLTRTFEFWYFTLVSLCCNTLLALNIGDLRVLSTVCETAMYQLTLVIDAKTQTVRRTIVASVMGAITLLSFVVLQQLDLVKDYQKLHIASHRTWRLETSEVIASGLSNVAAVLLRNAYRKWRGVSATGKGHTTVECVSYNTHLRLAEIPPSRRRRSTCSAKMSATPSAASLPPVALPSITQLRLAPLPLEIKADDFTQPWLSLPRTPSALERHSWTAVGLLGLFGVVVCIVVDVGRDNRSNFEDVGLAFLSLGCSGAFTLRCVLFHNRRLMRHMLWSFDYLFLTLQSYVAHIVLCILLRWNVAKCLIVWASWSWMYWVTTLDLLTPVVRERLGILSSGSRPVLAIILLALQVVAHIALAVELLFVGHWRIDDLVLLSFRIGDTSVEIYAIPFLITRMTTTFSWCLRLLFKLIFLRKNELILIQGAVEYDNIDVLHQLRGLKSVQPRIHIVQPTHNV